MKKKNTFIELTNVSKIVDLKYLHHKIGSKKITIYQIKALKSIKDLGVKKGDLGGYTDSLDTFSLGESWIDENSIVVNSVLPRNCNVLTSTLIKVDARTDNAYKKSLFNSVIINNSCLYEVKLTASGIYITNCHINNSSISTDFEKISDCKLNKCIINDSRLNFMPDSRNTPLHTTVTLQNCNIEKCSRIKLDTRRTVPPEIDHCEFVIKNAKLMECELDGANIRILGNLKSNYKIEIVHCNLHSDVSIIDRSNKKIEVISGWFNNTIIDVPKSTSHNQSFNLVGDFLSNNVTMMWIKGGYLETPEDILCCQIGQKHRQSYTHVPFYRSKEDPNTIVTNDSRYSESTTIDEIDAMIELAKNDPEYFADWSDNVNSDILNQLGLSTSLLISCPPSRKYCFDQYDRPDAKRIFDKAHEDYIKFINRYEQLLNYVRVHFSKPKESDKLELIKKKYNLNCSSDFQYVLDKVYRITRDIREEIAIEKYLGGGYEDYINSVGRSWARGGCCCLCKPSMMISPEDFFSVKVDYRMINLDTLENIRLEIYLPNNTRIIYKSTPKSKWKVGRIVEITDDGDLILEGIKKTYKKDKIQFLPDINKYRRLIDLKEDYTEGHVYRVDFVAKN